MCAVAAATIWGGARLETQITTAADERHWLVALDDAPRHLRGILPLDELTGPKTIAGHLASGSR